MIATVYPKHEATTQEEIANKHNEADIPNKLITRLLTGHLSNREKRDLVYAIMALRDAHHHYKMETIQLKAQNRIMQSELNFLQEISEK